VKRFGRSPGRISQELTSGTNNRPSARRRAPTIASEIDRYLRSGESDKHSFAWPGRDLLERTGPASNALREALVQEVLQRAPNPPVPAGLASIDLPRFTRRKVTPMVRGLFPAAEQEVVLGVLARSVIFLTPASVAEVLRTNHWDSTAWMLANLYLVSAGAEPLSSDAPYIVGLSEAATCYVAMSYFDPGLPLEDFLVHEAAHLFHNCKRTAIGLPCSRQREWLLQIDFRKRETFAYSCEAYSRLLEMGDGRASREALLDEHADGSLPACDYVDPDEYLQILRTAVAARNGFKQILAACAARGPRRPAAAARRR